MKAESSINFRTHMGSLASFLDFTIKELVALERLEEYQDRIQCLKGFSGLSGNEWGMGNKFRSKEPIRKVLAT